MVLLWTITLERQGGFSFEMYISNRSIQHFILFTFDPQFTRVLQTFIFRPLINSSLLWIWRYRFRRLRYRVSPFQLTFSLFSKVPAFSAFSASPGSIPSCCFADTGVGVTRFNSKVATFPVCRGCSSFPVWISFTGVGILLEDRCQSFCYSRTPVL